MHDGGSGEIRTRDQRIKSPLLYRLSYRPSKTEIIARTWFVSLGLLGFASTPCSYKSATRLPFWQPVDFLRNSP